MNGNEVHEELVVWLSGITAMKVIKDRQSIKSPALPYIVVDFANVADRDQHVTDIVYEELETTNTAGKKEIQATPRMEEEWTFLVQAYGEAGLDALRRVKSAAQLSQMTENLLPRLVVHEVGVINSIPEFIGQRWEPRAQTNITLRGVTSDGFVVDTIEEYSIDIERV